MENFCCDCKYHKPHILGCDECLKTIAYVNYVKKEYVYDDCCNINTDGYCPHFEKKETLKEKIKKIIKWNKK